jgi:hypothetical protein
MLAAIAAGAAIRRDWLDNGAELSGSAVPA